MRYASPALRASTRLHDWTDGSMTVVAVGPFRSVADDRFRVVRSVSAGDTTQEDAVLWRKSMKDLIADLDEWLRAHRADLLPKLNPPATDSELADLERVVGMPLPPDFRTLLRWHNGQPDDVFDTFHPLTNEMLVSSQAMVRTIQDMRSLAQYGDIKPSSWSSSWIPFMHNGGGDFSCLDAETGAVIYRNHESQAPAKTHPNLKHWLSTLVGELSTNNFPEWDIVECKPQGQ